MNKTKYLLTYRYSKIIHDVTVAFTKAYLTGRLNSLSDLALEEKFIKEGEHTESLFKKRLVYRKL